jgi:hypothetical protein
MKNIRKCADIQLLYAMLKKPTAQMAHLVFADPQAKRKKPKEPIFCTRSD